MSQKPDRAAPGAHSNESQQEHGQRRQRLHAEWRAQLDAGSGISAQALLALWSRYKYVLLAQDQRIYRQLGPLLADLSGDVQMRAEQTLRLVMEAMDAPASHRNHINALQHVAGYIKRTLGENEKQRWQQMLSDYESGSASLQATAGLLLEYLQRYGNDYVRAQCYPQFYLDR
jgi:uncharacterized protein YbgA (DUF1722 family)